MESNSAVADARAVGGYDLDRFADAHGWEDTDFFFRMRTLPLYVVRYRYELADRP